MGFKSEQKDLTFSDLEKSFKDEKNRSLKTFGNYNLKLTPFGNPILTPY